jgi:hypothetical protein
VIWICFENHEDEDRDKRVCSLVLSQVTEETFVELVVSVW